MKLEERKREEKAITLIALVITIIILLILAAVTIAALTGNNGILANAAKSKEETNKEGAREKLSIILMDLQTKKIPKGEALTLGDELAEEIGEYKEVESSSYTGDFIEVKIDGYSFEVNADLGIEKPIEKVEPENLKDLEYIIEDDGTATLTCYKGTDTTVIIPNYINGYWVKKISTNEKETEDNRASKISLWGDNICEFISGYDSWSAFVQSTIKEIIISYGIEEIDNLAFAYTANLEKVIIPRSVTSIGHQSFMLTGSFVDKENKLLEVNIYNNVKNMGYNIFDSREDIVINVEYESNEIPSTWNENWDKSKAMGHLLAIVKYGVQMD